MSTLVHFQWGNLERGCCVLHKTVKLQNTFLNSSIFIILNTTRKLCIQIYPLSIAQFSLTKILSSCGREANGVKKIRKCISVDRVLVKVSQILTFTAIFHRHVNEMFSILVNTVHNTRFMLLWWNAHCFFSNKLMNFCWIRGDSHFAF